MTTTEATTNGALPEISGYERLIAAGVFIIIAAMAILGNSLVILAVALSRKLQTTTNIYVVALTITDLLIGIIQVIQAVMLLSRKRSWFLLKVCSGAAALNFVLLGCSVSALALIAVNRMQVVTSKPLSSLKQTARKAVASIIIVYLFNALGLVGVGLIDRITFGNFLGICNYLGGNFTDYAIGVYIFILLIVITVCYGRIYHHIRHHYRQVAQMKARRIPNERPCCPGLHVIDVRSAGRNTSSKPPPGFNMILNDKVRIDRGCTSVPKVDANLKTSGVACGQEFASATVVSISELSKKPCEQAIRPELGEPSQQIADGLPVTSLPTNKGLLQIDVHSPANKRVPSGMATMSAEYETENIGLHHQEANLNENARRSSADNKTRDGSKMASNAISSLNRSANLRIPSKHECVGYHNNRMKAESRITLNMLLLVLTFVACMTPTIVQLLVPGQQDSSWIIFLILFSNCCWNPLIYSWKHPDFQHTFGCIIRGKFSRIRQPVPWLRRRITSN